MKDRNDFPTCPHCGESEYNYSIIFNEGQGDVATIDCWHCEKEYRVWRVVDVSYTTEKTQGEH